MTNHVRLTFYAGGMHYKETCRRLWPADNFYYEVGAGLSARIVRTRSAAPARRATLYSREISRLRPRASEALCTHSPLRETANPRNISRPRFWRRFSDVVSPSLSGHRAKKHHASGIKSFTFRLQARY